MTLWRVTLMILITSLMALVAGLMFASPSLAEETTDRPTDLFQMLDKNGDGTLKPDEIDESQQKAFDRLLRVGDDNNDGSLTKAEYEKGLKPDEPAQLPMDRGGRFSRRGGEPRMDIGRLFDTADRDGDGKIAIKDLPEPLQNRLQPLFERLGKEELTREDFDWLRNLQDRPPGPNGRPGPFGDRPPMALVRVLDEDGNGQLSKAELEQAASKFSELDRDNDGQLTAGELIGFPGGGPLARRDSPRPARPDGDNPQMQRPEDNNADSNRPRRPDGPSSRTRPADENGRRMGRYFAENDKDGDGQLTGDEIPETLRARLDRLDTNKDGQLSKDELTRIFNRRNRRSESD